MRQSNQSGLLSVVLTSLLATSLHAAEPQLRAVLLNADGVTQARIDRLKTEPFNAVVLEVVDGSEEAKAADRGAVERVRSAGLEIFYWVEVAWHPASADANPLRMASLQGHGEWRRFHKDLRRPQASEVTKVYPWTPILYRENFDAHLARVTQLLRDMPRPAGLLLNDLQAAPSACGCGNPVCRWTTDYGPIETATRLKDDAAAQFLAALSDKLPEVPLIPIWTTECEAHDRESLCAGIGCYEGLCWKRYAAQLAPVAKRVDRLGVLCLFKEFGQDVPHWKEPAGWVEHALRTFQSPPQNGTPIAPTRLLAVLQGWDVTRSEVSAQIAQATAAGVGGFVVAERRIAQSWEPRNVAFPPKDR